MRFVFLSFIIASFSLVTQAQIKPDIYSSPGSFEECKAHRLIAILPFFCLEDSADFIKSPRYQTLQEQQLGIELQHTMHTLMTSFHNRFTLEIQDIYVTNERLRLARLSDNHFLDMKTVVKALQVDAVIWGVVVTDAQQFKEDPTFRQFLERQHVPNAKRKDTFISVFDTSGKCTWTLSTNSEIIRSLLYLEICKMKFFEWMQLLPYWKGNRINPI